MAFAKKDDVTKENIAEWLNSAGIETIVDDDEDSVYAKRGGIDFGVYVKLDKERSRIRLFTFLQCKDDTDADALASFVSKLNDEYIFVRYTKSIYDDGRAFLNGDYDYLYTFGLSVENFVATLKKFASVYIDSIQTEDTEDVFFA